jgi:hypothetical protein
MNEVRLIIKSAKYLLPILTLMSLCKLVLYYSMFNINIGEYILVEEYLTPFVKDILIYLFFFVIPLLIAIVFFGEIIGRRNVESYKKIAALPFRERILGDLKRSWPILLIYIIALITYMVLKTPIELVLGAIIFYPLMSVVYWLNREFMIKHNIDLQRDNPAMINLILWLIIIFLLVMSNTLNDVYFVKYGKDETKIVCYNGTIDFKDSLGYIGRTKEFTFIYDKKAKRSIVLNNKEIKEIIK